MTERKLTFPSSFSDSRYVRLCEQAEKDGVFVRCGSVADKRLWLRFSTPEQEREWISKINLIR